MKVDVTKMNPSLESLFNNPNQVITLDANFLIPPDRPHLSNMSISFSKFKAIWLDPIFETFSNLAIHEAVRDELVSGDIKYYIQNKESAKPPQIIIHKDSELTTVEMMLRDSIEDRIFPLTKYDPQINNRDDRGEVKTLAYIAVKGLLYFAAHDFNALQLVEKAESWSTGLDTIQAIRMYEIIFYLCVSTPSLRKSLRMLYKYQYCLTKLEKSTNPEWGIFIKSMESLYQSHL
jgi:hypothetical protein